MKILSILAHPRTDSFCAAISRTVNDTLATAGHAVTYHDLYDEAFDPVLRAEEAYTVGESADVIADKTTDPVIIAHRAAIKEVEGLVVVHPNWWGKPPAILAGWLDRVLIPGVAYHLDTGDGPPTGLLNIKQALVLNTSDTPPDRERDALGDPLSLIWGNCVLPYCGVTALERRMFGPMAGSDPETRQQWLEEAKQTAACFGRPS